MPIVHRHKLYAGMVFVCAFAIGGRNDVSAQPLLAQNNVSNPAISRLPTGGNPPNQTPAWQHQEDYTESHLPGRLFSEMKKNVLSLAGWLQQGSPDSVNYSPAWCGAYFSNKDQSNGLPLMHYELRAAYFTDGTSTNLNQQDNPIEAATTSKIARLSISINDMGALQHAFDLNGHAYLSLPPMEEPNLGTRYANSSAGGRSWLISSDEDSLPYRIITRQEYLKEALGEIAAGKAALKSDLQQKIPVKSAEQEEAVKKQELAEINNLYTGPMRDNMERRFLASYKPDSIYFKEVFADQSAPLDTDSVYLDSLLNKSTPDFLERPAYVSVQAASFRHFEDSLPGARVLAKWNTDYFNKTASLAKPQFLVVSWSYDPADPQTASIDRQLRSRLDLCDLHSLLGK